MHLADADKIEGKKSGPAGLVLPNVGHKAHMYFNPEFIHFLVVTTSHKNQKPTLNAVELQGFLKSLFVSSAKGHAIIYLFKHEKGRFLGTIQDAEIFLCEGAASHRRLPSLPPHTETRSTIKVSADRFYFVTVRFLKTLFKWPLQKSSNLDAVPYCLVSTIVTGISHHRHKNEFITCGERVLLWDSSTKSPRFSYDWNTSGDGNEASVACVKFNPVETNLFASSDYANNLVLYDTRAKEVIKVKLTTRINALAWNPMEAFILTAASEDYNLYSFDIRRMDKNNRVINMHSGHTAAVMDLDYSPTGKEFCAGSYDKSIRIFRVEDGKSRDIYHTKRMFKVSSVLWSADNKYILSGSSDHNVRLWKARASEKMGKMKEREKASINYSEELKRKYGHFPEVRRIARNRHLPKHIYHSAKEHRIIKDSQSRKEGNRRAHSKKGAVPFVAARKKPIVGLEDHQ
ncbi:unnamed protein product, partial [Meganyctiphanes norvegica]